MFSRLGKYVTEPQLRRWSESQIRRGVPRQKVCVDVRAKTYDWAQNPDAVDDLKKVTEHNWACLNVEKAITQVMIDRNEKARQLERAGKIEQAIALFEESVKDQFFGTFPYDRLRIIYTKLKRYEDAIRVCQAYMDNPYLQGANKTKGRRKFREHIQRIKGKIR